MLLNCDIQQICFYRFSIKVCYSSIIIRFSTKFDSVFCFVLGVKMFLRNTLQVRFLLLFYYEYPDLFSFFFFLLRKRKWVMDIEVDHVFVQGHLDELQLYWYNYIFVTDQCLVKPSWEQEQNELLDHVVFPQGTRKIKTWKWKDNEPGLDTEVDHVGLTLLWILL